MPLLSVHSAPASRCMQSNGEAHWSCGVWQSYVGAQLLPGELEMQSHPAVLHDAPVLQVACAQCPMGFAQTHTIALPQSESTRQPWTHWQDTGEPASGPVSSQWP